jgi:SAM-dependent methyltransferase
MVHNKIKNIIYSHQGDIKNLLDIGGTGKLNFNGDIIVDNANITHGIDGTMLPYSDSSYDITVSIATLEHVNDHNAFLNESIRVCKKLSIHWFPMGLKALQVEQIKNELGHHHPCELPEYNLILKIPNTEILPYMTCREHLLLLSTIRKDFSISKLYDYIDTFSDNDYYGFFIIIHK